MGGLREIVIAGIFLVYLTGCDENQIIPLKEGTIGERKVRIIYEKKPLQEDRLRMEFYSTGGRLLFLNYFSIDSKIPIQFDGEEKTTLDSYVLGKKDLL